MLSSVIFECDKYLTRLMRYVYNGRSSTFGAIRDCDRLQSFHHEKIMQCRPHAYASYAFYIPLMLALMSFCCTGVGSWYCDYFQGARISSTSGHYGLWTLEDASGKCQLWDQLFFSYNLGPSLKTARFFSMVAQLDGLALVAVMTQALQFHSGSWTILLGLALLFVISVTTTGIFNMWAFFFLYSYVIFILIIRFLFIHPIHRRISRRGCKIIGWNCMLCSLFSYCTLVVLRSDFCKCESISSDHLEGWDVDEPCNGSCRLDFAGNLMICAGTLWGLTAFAVWSLGVQPEVLRQNEEVLKTHDFYPNKSIGSRITIAAGEVKNAVRSTFSTEIDCDQDQVVVLDTRSNCKKLCFDYRIIPRNRKEQCVFWTFRFIIVVLLVIYISVITLKVKSSVENINASRAPDTRDKFVLDEVCAFNPLNANEPFVSFDTKDDAVNAGYKVVHCGKCASCSNPLDIKTYVETRQIIVEKAKKCFVVAIFGTPDELTDCLHDVIGFSLPCTKCWTENMINDVKHCLYTCAEATLTGVARENNIQGLGNETVRLNQCIYCDEKMSGPAFVTCSGVARRRLGIVSEIERSPEEQCKTVDVDWVNVKFEDVFPSLNQPMP